MLNFFLVCSVHNEEASASMSMVFAADNVATGVCAKFRSRIAEGAPVWEPAAEDVPAWFAAEVAGHAVAAVFQSIHAVVAVLSDGRTVLRRSPRA